MGIFSELFGKKHKANNVRKRPNSPDVVDVQSDDDRMNWAIEKSVQRLNTYKSENGWKVLSPAQ